MKNPLPLNKPVSYTLAELLKENGFNVDVYLFYNISDTKKGFVWQFREEQNYNNADDKISAPTISEVLVWLWDTHGILINIEIDYDIENSCFSGFSYYVNSMTKESIVMDDEISYETLLDAYLNAIEHALMNI